MNSSKIPFHIGHQTPNEICFTRDSKYERDLIRTHDLISLNRQLLEPGINQNVEIRIIIHYPGQLIRDFDNPSFRSLLGSYNDKKIVELKISSVIKLKRRQKSNVRCNPDINNHDDRKFQREVIEKHVGCIPDYWSYSLPIVKTNSTCQSFEDLQKTYNLIQNFKDVLSYDPPCVEMTCLVAYANEIDQLPHQFYIKIIYAERFYQEIKNDKAFSFVALFSTAGGYLGLFLGYSLLQFPDFLFNAATFLRGLELSGLISKLIHNSSYSILEYNPRTIK